VVRLRSSWAPAVSGVAPQHDGASAEELTAPDPPRMTTKRTAGPIPSKVWAGYYRWTSKRPPRDLLLQALNHIEWERKDRKGGTAIDLGFGAGNDTLELLRRGWKVVAIDGQDAAVRFLERRVPDSLRGRLECRVASMEDVELPPADLVYASFSLPFCRPEEFRSVWSKIGSSLRAGGHFAGQLFGDQDEWNGERPLNFFSPRQVRRLADGLRIELLRETVEEGMSYGGPKHWHYFDLILGKPPAKSHVNREPR
jgi:tellurite methyltransferase